MPKERFHLSGADSDHGSQRFHLHGGRRIVFQESFSEPNDAYIKGPDDRRVSCTIDDEFGAASSDVQGEHI
jgi:hypothetical protein